MRDGFNKQKWTTAGGASAASFLEKWLRDKFDDAMHSMIDAHPITKRFLQMFFDSDLDSEIEKNAYMAITDAIISTVEELTKDGPLSKFHEIIVPIVHFVCKRLFLLKLAYHANAGRISKERFCELAAEHLAIETAAFVEKAWNMIPLMLEKGKVGLVGLLVYLGADPVLAEQTADKIDEFLLYLHPIVKKFITKENIKKLLKRTIEITIDASRIVLLYAEQISGKARQLYKSAECKLKSWRRAICEKLGWKEWDSFRESDANFSQKSDEEKDANEFSSEVADDEVDANEVIGSDVEDEEVNANEVNEVKNPLSTKEEENGKKKDKNGVKVINSAL